MKIVNDSTCSWINDLTSRTNIKSLESNEDSEWLIIGAGYTGLSAARKLAQLYSYQKIILVDAQLAGEGASSRNSGYLVDTTLNLSLIHISEPTRLLSISYAVFCLKKKKQQLY